MKRLIALVLVLLLAGCGRAKESEASLPSLDKQTENADTVGYNLTFTQRETESAYSQSGATLITLKDNACSVSGTGAVAKGNTVTVTGTNTCIISGTLTNGQVVVEIPKTEKVQIVLKNASITCADGPALYIKQADKVFLTSEGENLLADGTAYSDSYAEENAGAALYSKEDLAINGGGTLTVKGNYRHGITSKDDLVITDGVLNIEANEQGLHGKDCVKICNAQINIVSKTDGIQSDNTEEPQARGYVYIESGTLNITASDDGIKGENYLNIAGGTLNITAADDALHTEGELCIQNGNITVAESYEALEGSSINISGGNLTLTSSDDGLNAASGESAEGVGENPFAADESCSINISGGNIYIDAEGDGIDSNGSLKISGGVIELHGPQNSGNSALDYASDALISGGELIAFGPSQMAVSFNNNASQPTLMYNLPQFSGANTKVALKDAEGNTLLEASAKKSFSSIILSSSDIELGKTYSLYINGEKTEDITFSLSLISNGGMGGMGRPEGDMQRPDGDMQRPDGGMQFPEGGMQFPEGGMQFHDGDMGRPQGGMMKY